AVEAFQRAAGLLADLPGQKLDLAQTHNDLGVALRAAGRGPEAIRAHRKALGLLAEAGGSAPARLEQARAHNLLGALEGRTLRPRQAEKSQRAALETLEGLLKEDKNHPEYRHLLARATHDLSLVQWLDRAAEAGKTKQKALEVMERLAGD